MSTNAASGLASIVIPVWNQLEFTRQCISALRRHTRRAFELVVIDNGSSDGTGDYLAGVSDMASVPVTVIANETNRGFPAAINQGLKAARGEYLVLLNNDVVVTEGWLGQLIGLVDMKRGTAGEGAGAYRDASADGAGRPSVERSAGSGDPRTTGSVGTSPPPCSGVVSGSAGFTPPSPNTVEIGASPSLLLLLGLSRTIVTRRLRLACIKDDVRCRLMEQAGYLTDWRASRSLSQPRPFAKPFVSLAESINAPAN
jgi:glycosyltransferase involved in cell wall biosynthesis